ncbi:hypothetical protein COCVIDRAFT_88252 [Bipolaris victoriae FI3]|uniref:Uncharacterized protein n=1 Tax=Bipolaris victoriae (strain FI3) TaxID=930091 RepID=W7ESW8_BIPV3|nr:hypothetical protein COCVIDRAFT_88252 [Bipolaris victoriae FI3]
MPSANLSRRTTRLVLQRPSPPSPCTTHHPHTFDLRNASCYPSTLSFLLPINPIPQCCELLRHVPASVSCLASPLAERLTPFFSQSVPRQTDLDSCSGQPPNPGVRPQRRQPLSVPQTRAQIFFFSRCQWPAQTIPERPPSIHYGHTPLPPPLLSQGKRDKNARPTQPRPYQPRQPATVHQTVPAALTPPPLPHGPLRTNHQPALNCKSLARLYPTRARAACMHSSLTILHTRPQTAPTLLLFAQMQTSFVAAGP